MFVRFLRSALSCSIALLLWAPASGNAQENLTMDGAVERALDDHPQLAVWEAEMAQHEAAARQAMAYPNPEVELELEEWGIQRSWLADEAEGTLSVRQAIPLSGRRSAAASLARSGSGQSAAGKAFARAKLERQVRHRFTRAALAVEGVKLAQAGHQLSLAVMEAISRRIEAGDLAPAERTRVEVEVLQAELAVEDAESVAHTEAVALVATWGGDGAEELALATLPAPVAPAGKEGGEKLWTAASHARVATAQAAETLARAEVLPDLEVGLGWRESAGFESNSLVLSVGLPVPLWNKNEGQIDVARAEVRKARFEAAANKREWQAHIVEARARVRAAQTRHETLRARLLPALEAAHQTVQDGFSEGRFNALDLIASRQRLLEGKHDALETLKSYWEARIDLDWLQGRADKEIVQ
jgi:outer membrane protein, heavy metal efflux system